MADIQVQIIKEQPINVFMADPKIIQVQIIKEQPINVILNGQIGIKGDKGDMSDVIYASMCYDVDNDPIFYIGEALLPNALEDDNVWRIKKITVSGNSVVVLWANGNQNLTNIWNQRLSLSYS